MRNPFHYFNTAPEVVVPREVFRRILEMIDEFRSPSTSRC